MDELFIFITTKMELLTKRFGIDHKIKIKDTQYQIQLILLYTNNDDYDCVDNLSIIRGWSSMDSFLNGNNTEVSFWEYCELLCDMKILYKDCVWFSFIELVAKCHSFQELEMKMDLMGY